MIERNVNELKENEVLARHILTETGSELIAAGTVLKTEYIDKLKELGITFVYIEEKSKSDFEEEVGEKTKEEVKNILETHVYKNSSDLSAICEVADKIIEEVINEEKIIEQIASVKRIRSDLYSHSVNVCAMASVLALKNGLEDNKVKEIARGSLLHDIGLRYVTVEYENNDVENCGGIGTLEYKKHTIYGYDAVKQAMWLGDTAKDIILFHHERLDGKGFPLKLKKKQIKNEVQIFSVCDAFDEMICGIGCEKKKNYEAIEYMRDYSNIKFNAKYVEQLMNIAAMYPCGTNVLLSTGQRGIVKSQNKGYIDRPVVNIIDENKNILSVIDMVKNLTVFIEEVFD